MAMLLLLYLLGVSLAAAPAAGENSHDDLIAASPGSLADDIAFDGGADSFRFGQLDTSPLLERQQRVCPPGFPVDCGVGCCPASSNCCPGSSCCPTSSNCWPNGKCCPKAAVTCNRGYCAQPGSTCCGSAVCKPGFTCMTTEDGEPGCCLSGQTACNGGFCCPPSSSCSSRVGFCRRFVLSTSRTTSTSRTSTTSRSISSSTRTLVTSKASTRTSTSRSVSTSRSTMKTTKTSTSSSSRRMCTKTAQSTGFSCENEGSGFQKRVASPTQLASSPAIGARQSDDDDEDVDGGYLQYCELCGEKIPVMIFPYVTGETEELIESTCAGIGGGDQIMLHWAGDGRNDERRSQSGCNGYCARRGESFNKVYKGSNQCDEFPPASSLEGGEHNGVRPHKMCIFWKQNQLGGHLYLSYSVLFNLKPGQKYIIRVVPGCSGIIKRQPRGPVAEDILEARAASSSATDEPTQLSKSASDWVHDPRPGAGNGNGYVLVPISDAQPGRYNLQLALSGPAENVSITDGDGTEYTIDNDPSDLQSYSFDLKGAADLSVGAYVRKDQNIKASYTCNVTASTDDDSEGGSKDGAQDAAPRSSTLSLQMLASIGMLLMGVFLVG